MRHDCKTCGRRHDFESWLGLKLVGYVGKRAGHAKWVATELRNCVCGSTLAVDCRWVESEPDEDDVNEALPVQVAA